MFDTKNLVLQDLQVFFLIFNCQTPELYRYNRENAEIKKIISS